MSDDNGEKPQPSIDERIQALTESGQLVFEMLKDNMANIDRLTEEIRQANRRERKGRQAILAGLEAYLRALEDDDESQA